MCPSWLLIYALQWFALAIVSVHAFRAITYARAHTTNVLSNFQQEY